MHHWSFVKAAVLAAAACLTLIGPTRADLVQYWRFDETSGSIASNSVTGGIDGELKAGQGAGVTTNTSPFWSTDVPTGQTHSTGSLRFESTLSEWVNVGPLGMLCDNQSPSLHGTTVSMWVKPDVLANGGQFYDWTGVGASSIHAPAGSNNGNVGGPQMKTDGSISIMGRDTDGLGYKWYASLAPAGSITSGNWRHVAVTYIGDKAFCYVDGQVGDAAALFAPFTFDNTAEFGLGCKRNVINSPQQAFFDGLMDDVAIWNTALTPAAIAELAAGADPTTVVERPVQPDYVQVVNVDIKRITDAGDQLPTYTGRGVIEAAGNVWAEAMATLGEAQGDRDAIVYDAVDSQGTPTSIDVRIVDFRTVVCNTTADVYGSLPNPMGGDRMWASAESQYAPEQWYVDDLEVGATYDIYFLGEIESTVAVTAGVTAPSSVEFLSDFADADFRIADDVPADWVEGINYVKLRVTPASSTISGTIAPDMDGTTVSHLFGIQIARVVPEPSSIVTLLFLAGAFWIPRRRRS